MSKNFVLEVDTDNDARYVLGDVTVRLSDDDLALIKECWDFAAKTGVSEIRIDMYHEWPDANTDDLYSEISAVVCSELSIEFYTAGNLKGEIAGVRATGLDKHSETRVFSETIWQNQLFPESPERVVSR